MTHFRVQFMNLSRRLRREARSDDRSWAQLLLLGAIDRSGGTATPSMLAESGGLQTSNLATALRDLEAHDLVVRTPDTEDRRKTRVSLTKTGRDLLYGNRARRDSWLTQAVEQVLTEDERRLLLEAGALLERIAAAPVSDSAEI